MIDAVDNISTKLMASEASLHFILYVKSLCNMLRIVLIKDQKGNAE